MSGGSHGSAWLGYLIMLVALVSAGLLRMPGFLPARSHRA